MRRFAVVLAGVFGALVCAQERVEPGRAVQGRFAPGEVRRYVMPLGVDQYVHVSLRSEAAVAALRLVAPDGNDAVAGVSAGAGRRASRVRRARWN